MMKKLDVVLARKKGLLQGKPVSDSAITECEQKLSVKFSDDYKECVRQYGALSYYGHELTGVVSSPRLNVVEVTKEERETNSGLPDNWYVIEQTGMDGIVIWQADSGEIFQSSPTGAYKKICNSLAEYIELD